MEVDRITVWDVFVKTCISAFTVAPKAIWHQLKFTQQVTLDFLFAGLTVHFQKKKKRKKEQNSPCRWKETNTSVTHTCLADILNLCLIQKHALFIWSNWENSHLSCWQACDWMYDDQSCSQTIIIPAHTVISTNRQAATKKTVLFWTNKEREKVFLLLKF